MALTPEDLAEIKAMLAASTPAPAEAPAPAGPPAQMYWVHLADGRVIETTDSAATHIDGVAVIGRYAQEA